MLHALAGGALRHAVFFRSLRKASLADNIVKNFERSDVYRSLSASSSLIALINFAGPPLSVRMESLAQDGFGVNRQK